MKTRILLVFCLFLLARISTAQYVTIPDANFRAFLKQSYPTCFNSQDMMDTTCSAVLTARTMYFSSGNIANLQGIQYFKGLGVLECSFNQLTSLPALPAGLTKLSCGKNQLISLPALPAGLTELDCSGNQLTSLPALPAGLTWLNCNDNQLTNLPALPAGLTGLNCGGNQLTSLPALPAGLTWLYCYYNPNLSCLPNLPNVLYWLDISNTQITCLPNKPARITSTLPICTSPCVLGIEVRPEMRLSIAPNPATESCRVEFDTRGKLGTLTLTDALGRTVKSVELQGSGQHDFSVADMPSGVYYLRVNAEGKLLASGKLVVEK